MRDLQETVTRTMTRLEDIDGTVWPRSEITRYIKSGYDRLTRSTRCLWDLTFLENLPYCANHTAKWEEEYMHDTGDSIQGIFNFTGGAGTTAGTVPWEQTYCDGIGPAFFTAPWEMDYTYPPGSTTLADNYIAVEQLPLDTVDIDRVTYDNYRISPLHSSDLAEGFKNYEYTHSAPRGYTLDKDGFFSIRKVPTPNARADVYEYSGTYGLIRQDDDDSLETTPTIIGTYGILRSIPLHFPSGTYGASRRIYRDGSNTRVEYFRRGHDLEKDQVFEVPDRYVKYIELYAMARAREREGPGQDTKLASHFDKRFGVGVQRLLHRAQVINKERVARMGGASGEGGWPELAQLPYHYPRVPFYRR